MLIAIGMVRDEEDIIGHTLAHMLTQVDHAIIADNLSTDRTRAILHSFGQSVTIVDDPELAYRQAEKSTRLAHMAGDMGASWVVPFDADEAWFLPPLETVDAEVVQARPYVYVPQPSDSDDPNPIRRVVWRQPAPERLFKVCFRYHPDVSLHMGNHDVVRPGRRVDEGVVRHYQYRSLEQVRRKVSNGVQAYNAAAELPSIYGTHWRELAERDDVALEAWWDEYTSQPLEYAP